MKKSLVLLSLSALAIVALLFSCTNKPASGVVSSLVLTIESNVEVDQYVVTVSDSKGNVVVTETFEPRAKLELKGLNIPAGDYRISVKGFVGGNLVIDRDITKRLEPGSNNVDFVMGVKATLDVEYYSRAENFKAYFEDGKLVLRYKKQNDVNYTFFALVSEYGNEQETWIPLDSKTGWTETQEGENTFIRIPINNNKIEYKDSKGRIIRILPVDRIVLLGVNATTTDGKPSGISPAPIIEQEIQLGGRMRSTPAVWKNPDDPQSGDPYGIYVFTTSDDGKVRAFGYKNGKLELLDEVQVGCFGLMSPVVEERMHNDKRYVNVYVVGYDSNNDKSILYKLTFDPYTYRKLRNTGDEDFPGKVESTPVFVNGHIFVTTYRGEAYVVRPTDMSEIATPSDLDLNLGNSAIVTSPAVVGNDVYVLAPNVIRSGNQEKVILQIKKVDLSDPFNPKTTTIATDEIFFRSTTGFYANATASSPAVANGKIYFGSMDGILYEVDTAASPATVRRFNLTLGRIDSSPVIDQQGYVYFGTDAGYVVKYNPSATATVWKYYTGNDVRGVRDAVRSTPLLGNDGVLYVGSYEGYIYALRMEDGQIVWRYQALDRVWGSPTLIPVGTNEPGKLLVGGHDYRMYMIRVKATNLASAPWPKFRKNLVNN